MSPSPAPVPGAHQPVGDRAPQSVEVVRSREQLRVGLERVPYERVVVRKVVVTEERTVTVVLRREELVVERFAVDDPTGSVDATGVVEPAGDPTGRARVLDVVLHHEEPEISVRVVPHERVRVSTRVVTGQRTVTADVRVEQVAAEGRPATQAERRRSGPADARP